LQSSPSPAADYWWDGGHMDPDTLACTHEPECGSDLSCEDLGYPSYYVCDGTQRCVVDL
jgi:hypothetical protein